MIFYIDPEYLQQINGQLIEVCLAPSPIELMGASPFNHTRLDIKPDSITAAPLTKGRINFRSKTNPANRGPAIRPRLIKELLKPMAMPCWVSAPFEVREQIDDIQKFIIVFECWLSQKLAQQIWSRMPLNTPW